MTINPEGTSDEMVLKDVLVAANRSLNGKGHPGVYGAEIVAILRGEEPTNEVGRLVKIMFDNPVGYQVDVLAAARRALEQKA